MSGNSGGGSPLSITLARFQVPPIHAKRLGARHSPGTLKGCLQTIRGREEVGFKQKTGPNIVRTGVKPTNNYQACERRSRFENTKIPKPAAIRIQVVGSGTVVISRLLMTLPFS